METEKKFTPGINAHIGSVFKASLETSGGVVFEPDFPLRVVGRSRGFVFARHEHEEGGYSYWLNRRAIQRGRIGVITIKGNADISPS